MKIQIKNHSVGFVIYETEIADNNTLPMRMAIIRAAAAHANLTGADLVDTDLNSANLARANLVKADLAGADLSDAELTGAVLVGADLTDANLARANLTGANLTGANLTGANLTGAEFSDANLTDTNLTEADLTGIRKDFHARLSLVAAEVPSLLTAVRDGRIDGSAYQGDCACFIGTIANIRDVSIYDLGSLKPEGQSPTEKFFLAIREGDIPDNCQVSAIVEGWILEWQAARGEGELIHDDVEQAVEEEMP